MGLPRNEKADLLAKLVPLCPLMRSQALSPQLVPKSVIANTRNWRRHISHSHLTWRLLLSRSIRSELSRLRCHGHSLLLSSYLHRSVGKRILIVVPVDTLYRTSIISSSTVVLMNPSQIYLWLLSFYSRSMVQTLGVARLLGLRGVPPRPHPSEGVG